MDYLGFFNIHGSRGLYFNSLDFNHGDFWKMKMPTLNKFEIGYGIFIQMPLYFLIGNQVFITAALSGLLWAYGGAQGTSLAWRRFGSALVACVSLWLFYKHSWGIIVFYPIAAAIIGIGYGEKAWLWKFLNDGDDDHRFADYVTRTFVCVAYWGALALCLYLF